LKRADTARLARVIVKAMEDIKAQEVLTLDVRKLTDVTDIMVIASGTSSRHVRAIADNVLDAARAAGRKAFGSEGKQAGDWILVDFGSVLVHVMGVEARRFYALEKLWAPAHAH
jgi:ribosome-associated protein